MLPNIATWDLSQWDHDLQYIFCLIICLVTQYPKLTLSCVLIKSLIGLQFMVLLSKKLMVYSVFVKLSEEQELTLPW